MKRNPRLPPLDDPGMIDAPDEASIGPDRFTKRPSTLTMGEARGLSAGAAYAYGFTDKKPGWDYWLVWIGLATAALTHLLGWW